MEAREAWKVRWDASTLPMAKTFMEVASRKKSLVCLAADKYTMSEMFDLLGSVGSSIAALKTHVDLIDDWTPEEWMRFCELAHEMDLLIFEDRKFADIGKISQKQMGGIYNIQRWSDIVTAHLISGPDIVDGLQSAWSEASKEGGVLLLAQMSSRGNLLTPAYTSTVVEAGRAHPGVFGFIGNGSDADSVRRLREMVGEAKMIWTPGVNLATGDGEMGQRYGDPYQAVVAGADCIIVGSGIHGAEDPAAAAATYAEISWKALLER
ncbi:MAG TPA: orotidine-5'-phosphate decarboxylase [Candidatus Poseidoniaceae archaeon]|nr:orotidine-5'-phosphate decarboxylase [Candidatus Poseidoniaceae archaeon]